VEDKIKVINDKNYQRGFVKLTFPVLKFLILHYITVILLYYCKNVIYSNPAEARCAKYNP